MELPFAVESSTNHVSSLPHDAAALGSSNHGDDDAGSLVTASSQGSLIQSQHSSSYEPARQQQQQQQQQQQSSKNHQPPVSISSSLAATGSRVASVFSNLTTTTKQTPTEPVETIDFTSYVNVWETDADEVDILLPSSNSNDSWNKGQLSSSSGGDLLTLLLNRVGPESGDNNMVQLLEQAHQSAQKAAQAKLSGHLQEALDHHAASAKLFHQAALLAKPSHGTRKEAFCIGVACYSVLSLFLLHPLTSAL